MEPSQDTIPASWDEARGPHLPDRLTAIPVMVWPFVALTALLIYVQIRRSAGMPIEAPTVASFGLGLSQMAAMTLLGAVLFLRHPDAWERLRPVAVGVALLAAAEGLRVLAPSAEDLVGGGWDGTGDLPIVTVSYGVYRAGAIAGILGVASLWVGLRAARRAPDPSRTRALLAVLLVVGLAILAIGYARLIQSGMFGEGVAALANTIVIAGNGVDMVAWLAVASVLIAGARVRERPAGAWRVGAIAALGIALVREPISWLLPQVEPSAPGFSTAYWFVLVAMAGAAILLLVAFAQGLPAPSEAEATADPG